MLNTKIGENYGANDVINSTDLRKRLLNIDSRFRANQSDPTSDFSFKLEHPYKNLIRVRLASIEIPNTFYTFSQANKNTIIGFKTTDSTASSIIIKVQIPDGNYTATELITAIQTQFTEIQTANPSYGTNFQIQMNPNSRKVTITNNRAFIFDTGTIPDSQKKWFYYGLGSYLGFPDKLYTSQTSPYTVTSTQCINPLGSPYLLLEVNDYYSVEQKTTQNYVQCLAKIIVNKPKYDTIENDGSNMLSNDVIFPSPTDLSTIRVRLLDAYGNVVDLCGANFSFALEITEVLNTRLYDFYRNYIWLGTIPSVNYKKVQGSAQPLLKGIGPPF
jgi:hypothetical protein